MKIPFTLLTLALTALAATPPCMATDTNGDARGAWWFAGGAGYGSMRLTPETGPDESDELIYINLAGGRVITDQFWLGLEVSGWLYQPSNLQDPTDGEWVNEIALTSRIALARESRWHVALGAGWATHASNHPGDTRQDGTAWSAGLGYDFAPVSRSAAQVALVFDRLSLDHEELQAVTARVTWRWR